ncbi:MAG: hypothetical protein QGI05_00195 [Candidatus Omnitrophota bacterium]|jgi:epoxyqueuosine reductase QueG|nr:hypothetical protein [Candidatus Omnitrophota bacterium]
METKTTLYKELKGIAGSLGSALFGVAEVGSVKKEFYFSDAILKDLDYAISIAYRLSDPIIEDIIDVPTKLYYHHYRQVNVALDQISLAISNVLQGKGYRALPLPASQIINWKKQRAHLSHTKIAELAGIGFVGRNNLLVNPEFGSRIRTVTILTNAPLGKDEPLKIDCGACRSCINACPAKAIKETKEGFDRVKCYEKLKEFRDKNFVGQYICGICVKSCKGKL